MQADPRDNRSRPGENAPEVRERKAVTPIANMMMVSNVVTCGAMPVNVAGEKYATTEMRTAQRGNKRVTRESMERRSWLIYIKGTAQGAGMQGCTRRWANNDKAKRTEGCSRLG
jgi:hypothetical protein